MNLKKTPAFKVEKLYLDCIDEAGNCFIIYWTHLEFYFLKLRYSGLIFSDSENITHEKSTLRKSFKPSQNDTIHFENSVLKIQGNWQRIDEPISWILYKDKLENELLWNCHHPKAAVEILYQGKKIQGLGYAETLFMPMKPWNLPLDELRWGRFLSHNYTIVWIQWKGTNPVNKIMCNQILYEDAIFDDGRIIFNRGEFELLFLQSTIIRKGKLSNILSKMPWLKIIFNRRILNTLEIKYKSKSVLYHKKNRRSEGWSLYEIVTLK